MNREPVYDGIRGFAFLLVLSIHGFAICYDGAFRYLQGCGKYGVWLFFVLSSFLLTKNYLIPNGNKLEYVVARIFRILPLYFICCLTYVFLGIIKPAGFDWVMLLIAQFGAIHLWTIPVEFYFYAILLALWMVNNTITRDVIFLLCSLISLAVLLLYSKDENSTNTLWYLAPFCVGYFLARTWDYLPVVKCGDILASIVLFIFIILNPGIQYIILDIEPSPYLMNMYFPLSIIWGFFIYVVGKSKPNLANNLLSSRLMTFLGGISYSGYLFHVLVMVKLKELMGTGIITVVLSIILSIILAYIVSSLVERPVYKVRRKIIRVYKSISI